MPRRISRMLLLGSLTAGACVVVNRVRSSPRRLANPEIGSAHATGGRSAGTSPSTSTGDDVGPTGPEAMVVATMEVTPVTGPRSFGGNGSRADRPEPPGAELPKVVVGAVELPPRKRLSGPTIAAFAALAGIAAILLGSWAFVSSVTSDDTSSERAQSEQVISLLSKPSTERVPVDGSAGRIVLAVGTGGRAYLVLDGARPGGHGQDLPGMGHQTEREGSRVGSRVRRNGDDRALVRGSAAWSGGCNNDRALRRSPRSDPDAEARRSAESVDA